MIKILVADDLQSNRLVLGMMLKKILDNPSIEYCNNIHTAYKNIIKNNYDIIFLDNKFDDGYAMDYIEKIKDNDIIKKIILLTGYNIDNKQLKIINKPTNMKELKTYINNII